MQASMGPSASQSFDTQRLHHCVQQWQGGNAEAADALVRAIGERLERISRSMLRRYPAVRACADTVDLLQGSLLRLLTSLRRIQPESTRHFFNLAAVHVRRELLDLGRRFSQKHNVHVAVGDCAGAVVRPGPVEAPAEDDDLELWCRFHEAVERLPEPEREVMGLAFYDGWTQAQIGELLEVDQRTVRRRWQSACLRLQETLGDRLPRP
jgi:RNA polymerase sigma factor (sigma-70 family)